MWQCYSFRVMHYSKGEMEIKAKPPGALYTALALSPRRPPPPRPPPAIFQFLLFFSLLSRFFSLPHFPFPLCCVHQVRKQNIFGLSLNSTSLQRLFNSPWVLNYYLDHNAWARQIKTCQRQPAWVTATIATKISTYPETAIYADVLYIWILF